MSNAHTFTISTTIAALQAEQNEEDGACVTLYPTVRRTQPLPAAVWNNGLIQVVDANGDLFLVEVLDFHDGYEFGGPASFVYVALV